MDRTSARRLARTTLEDLGLFRTVTSYEPDRLSGSTIAVVHSKSLAMLQDGRDDFDGPCEVWVTIYLRRLPDAGEAAEDALDDLVRQAMRALWTAFYDVAANLQIGPSEAGIPKVPIDGKQYRMERFPIRFSDNDD